MFGTINVMFDDRKNIKFDVHHWKKFNYFIVLIIKFYFILSFPSIFILLFISTIKMKLNRLFLNNSLSDRSP